MKKDEILEFINIKVNGNLGLENLLQPSISFNLAPALFKNEMNNSKIGGVPSFFGAEWPVSDNHSLTFLGQIVLNQICEINDILPKKGILLFFILTCDIGYRYPDKNGESGVIYVENPDEESFLKNTSTESLKEFSVNFYENYTFPSYQESIIEKNNITDNELEIIEDIENEIMDSLNNNYDIEHQLLGHPKAVQGTVRFWWSMKYLGIELKDKFSKEEEDKIRNEEENFILLLQLNFGDSKIEFDYFGDSVAYFGIHKNDLKDKKFENVVLVMQNT